MSHPPPSDTDAPLDFTGERFTPECVREIWYEHWHRYVFALPLARGRRVLDAACGEGYGSALLARTARSVTGVDVDADTITHAARRYGDADKLQFQCASVTAIDAPDASFDLIVSFETIEHLAEQAQMLAEFDRLLAPGGLLLISSPDRDNYNAAGVANPFHVRELDRDEFEGLLAAHFPQRRVFGQRLGFHSVVWSLDQPGPDADGVAGPAQASRLDTGSGQILSGPMAEPMYYLAACARRSEELPAMPGLSLFADQQQSVYSHYNNEIRRVIAGGHRILELERELAELKAGRNEPR
ncbi:MAG: class I SAM-dependent methyltransferase [Xanthomonadales bacterium]|nr:class I SAM-dependent methyltransferase [Xanthomonadales bacterium]